MIIAARPLDRPSAVLFDLDNTLTHRQASIEAFAARFCTDHADRLEDVSPGRVAELLVRVDNGGYLPNQGSGPGSSDRLKHAIVNCLARDIGWIEPPSFDALRDYWNLHFALCAVPMAGFDEVFDKLHRMKIATGVITNGSEATQEAKVRSLGIRRHTDLILVSEAVHATKPDPAIFSLAAGILGLAPARIWYLGDHPVNDVEGARLCGFQSIWLRGFHQWPDELKQPVATVDDLHGVVALLDSLDPGASAAGASP